jgi:membrane-associated phospholipid phosphatase
MRIFLVYFDVPMPPFEIVAKICLLRFMQGKFMRLRPFLFLMVALSVAQRCPAQETLLSSPDTTASLDTTLPLPAAESSLYTPVAKPSPERQISWRRLVPNMVQDQKRIGLFPVSMAHGHHLLPVLAVAGVTAGFMAIDEHNAKYFRNTQTFAGLNKVLSGSNSALGMEIFPAAFYAIGLTRKDSYAQHTVLLAGEAVLDSEILTSVIKDVDRRFRPASVPPGGDFSHSWFQETRGSYIGGVGSFPSGHAIAAFSIATVFAKRYPNPRWHVWLAYGLASLVGFSRLSLQSHFSSDVFAGAALGFTITHYVVLRPRSSLASQDAP